MRGFTIGLALVALAITGGCSGSDKPEAADADTTTTAAPTTTVEPTTTTTTISKEQQRENDETAIRHVVEYVNGAFRTSTDQGIAAMVAANYSVVDGTFTADQCLAYWHERYRQGVTEDAVIQPGSILPAPGWVSIDSGKIPEGRIYSLTVDFTLTYEPTGQQEKDTYTIHATVLPDGNAKLFYGCTD